MRILYSWFVIAFLSCNTKDEGPIVVHNNNTDIAYTICGDYPENNIEALIKSEKDFPTAEYQVMIADNWAAIKDKVLWQHLTKPVRIVVCGATEFNVNIDYLNLARKTNGSVHLMESDLYNLAGLKEGEILKVGKNTFVVKNGMFVETGYDDNK